MGILDKLPLTDLRCTKCGESKCDCWVRCSCGWYAEKHKPCRNPNTTRCSTKLMYGKRQRKGKNQA